MSLIAASTLISSSPNNPPTWTSVPAPQWQENVGGTYALANNNTDPESDVLTYAWDAGSASRPAWLTLNTVSGVLTATTGAVAGTITGLLVTIDDGVNPPVVSSAFSVAVSSIVSAQTLRDAGYLLVDDYSGVDSSGSLDSTTGFNQAALDSESTGKTVWVTESGTYRVTGAVLCGTWGSGPGIKFQGGGVGATRPKIILDDGASGFASAGSPRGVVIYRNFENGAPDRTWPSDPMDSTGIWKGKAANAFDSYFSNIDIDCGNNAGAFGMYMPSAQFSFASDVTIDCSNALGGWWGLLGRNSPIMNLKVIGGTWQIKNDARSGESTAGSIIAGLTLVGDSRTTTPIITTDFVPLTIIGFDFTRTTSGSFVQIQSHSQTGYAHVALIDGIIHSAGGTVFDNAQGKNTYLRNVYVSGTNNLVQSKALAVVTGAGTWKLINEYVYNDVTAFNSAAGQYPSESLIDGTVSSAEEPATSISSSVVAPVKDYVLQHTIIIPKIDSGPFVNILDHGAVSGPTTSTNNAYRNNSDNLTADSRAAIQAAVTAAKNAGHNTVFVPFGFFYVGSPGLTLEPNTIFIGTGSGNSVIGTHGSWQPTSQVYVVTSADDPNGTAHWSNVSIAIRTIDGTGGGTSTPYQFDWFSFMHWRTGRNSSVISVNINSREFQNAANVTNPKTYHEYSGSAGGKHYGLDVVGRAFGHLNSRAVRFQGTSEPLHIYGFNVEATKSSAAHVLTNVEIEASANIRLYGSKREGSSSTSLINDSTNIGLYGMGRQAIGDVAGNVNVHKIIGTSNNILIADSTVDQAGLALGSSPHVFEDRDATAAVQIDWAKGVSIYKRGTIDDSLVEI